MSLKVAEKALRAALAGEVTVGEPMARHTTYRVGGPASLRLCCDGIADLSSAIRILSDQGIPWTVLGKGSNVLVSDSGYEGAVIVLGREFRNRETTVGHIRAGAATILAQLVNDAFSAGVSGLETCVGIPGTLGGALAMNAGTRDGWIGEVVESVTLFVPGEGLLNLHGPDIDWGYRDSGLSQRGIIVEGVLRVAPGDRDHIRRAMEESFRRRKETQPVNKPSAGSVFVNPPGDSAGRLIQEAGLKGTRIGGAVVSEVHANFIVNDSGATAEDIYQLIRRVQSEVKGTHGIDLRTEIKFLGRFE